MSRAVKKPVLSITTSTPRSPQGSLAGSRSAKTLTSRAVHVDVVGVRLDRGPGSGRRWSRRRADGPGCAVSVMSLTATISMSGSSPAAARKTFRPMRPNPLMPTRTLIPHVLPVGNRRANLPVPSGPPCQDRPVRRRLAHHPRRPRCSPRGRLRLVRPEPGPAAPGDTEPAVVVRVVDGDTLIARVDGVARARAPAGGGRARERDARTGRSDASGPQAGDAARRAAARGRPDLAGDRPDPGARGPVRAAPGRGHGGRPGHQRQRAPGRRRVRPRSSAATGARGCCRRWGRRSARRAERTGASGPSARRTPTELESERDRGARRPPGELRTCGRARRIRLPPRPPWASE